MGNQRFANLKFLKILFLALIVPRTIIGFESEHGRMSLFEWGDRDNADSDDSEDLSDSDEVLDESLPQRGAVDSSNEGPKFCDFIENEERFLKSFMIEVRHVAVNGRMKIKAADKFRHEEKQVVDPELEDFHPESESWKIRVQQSFQSIVVAKRRNRSVIQDVLDDAGMNAARLGSDTVFKHVAKTIPQLGRWHCVVCCLACKADEVGAHCRHGYKTSFQCNICFVPLCVVERIQLASGEVKSCWDLFHETRRADFPSHPFKIVNNEVPSNTTPMRKRLAKQKRRSTDKKEKINAG